MIQITGLHKNFVRGKINVPALRNISFSMNDLDMIAITGTSGAGKTTLLNIITGLETYEKGYVQINNIDIKKFSQNNMAKFRNNNFGIVMQRYSLISDFSVFDNVCLPLSFSNKKYGKKEKENVAMKALSLVGIEALAKKYVDELSGGEMQRVAIARAVINSPKYIIADEPTGSLDRENTKKVINVLKKINDTGVGVIIVTHDMEVAQSCKRIIELDDGKIVSDFFCDTE